MNHSGVLAPDTVPTGSGAIGKVGPGDTLSISIMGPGGMQANVTVDMDGTIVAPFIGTMQAAGRSPAQIGRELAAQLKARGYLEDPQVAVAVLTLRSRSVTILGHVAHPGRYPLDSRLSLFELLAMAGGPLPDAGDEAVLIHHAGRTAQPTGQDEQERLPLYVEDGRTPARQLQDTRLRAGDVVFLPAAKHFYVYGQVNKPGEYPVEANLNVMRALALAGGITDRGSDWRIDLDHIDPVTGKHEVRRVKLGDTMQAGDVLRVRERIF